MSVQLKIIDKYATNRRLDNYLIKHLKGVPKSFIYRIIRSGSVRVNKGRKKANYKLQLGDVVRIPPVRTSVNFVPKISAELARVLKKNILYKDEDLLVLNKPPGLASHAGSGVSIGVIEAMRQIYNTYIELVHRLDRGTSGCLLLAQNHSALTNLQEQLRDRAINKQYWALLSKAWQKKTHIIDAPLLKIVSKGNTKVIVSDQGINAISYFQPLKNITTDNYNICIANITIRSGRIHQIRAHAQYACHPVIGDSKYGDKNSYKLADKLGIKRLCLHAKSIKFIHPTTQKLSIVTAPVDKSLLDIAAKIG